MKEFKTDTVLLMLSGGLDSSFLLYYLLTNTNYEIHAHHIIHKTDIEPRWEEEEKATRKIVDFCYKTYRPLACSYSGFDFRRFLNVGWDSDVQILTAAMVARNLAPGNISVAIGWIMDDTERPIVKERIKKGISNNLWKACRDSIDVEYTRDRVNPNLWFPLIENGLYKTDIIKKCPNEIKEMAWSCRRPKVVNGKTEQCGRCHACKLIKNT